ncbi:MAG: G8 domain-containing protein [Ignavibacteria bacterium]
MSTNFKIILTLVFLTGMFLQDGNAATITSATSGNWSATTTWTGNVVPGATDIVTIQNGHTVTLDANTAALASLTINSGGTLTTTVGFNFSATTITVSGTYVNGSIGSITGTMTVGGTYQHNINGGTVKTATWIAGSTCNVSGTTSSVPSGLNQSFKNFTWSSTNTSAISISPTAINGDFNITAGGGTDKYLRINTASFTIGGNLNLSGSANLQISNSTQRTLTVNGNFSMTNGTIDMATSTKVGTLNVKGDFSFTGGTIKSTLTSGSIVFNGTTSQTFTSGGTVTGTINYTVNNLAILQMAAENSVVNGNAFTLSSGATLGITSANGISTAGNATGNVRTTTRTYSTSANYIYNGSSAQVTGNGLTSAANLTINNTAGVTTSGDLAVNGILNLQSANPSATKGALEMVTNYGSNQDTIAASYTLTMGSTSTTVGLGDVTGYVKRTTIVAGTSYTFGNQFTTISLTSGTMPSSITVTIKIGAAPSGKSGAVKRSYEIVPTDPGVYTSTVAANFHFLDGELNSNTLSNLVTWDFDLWGGSSTPDEHGRAAYDISTAGCKYVGMANIPIDYFINKTGHSWRTIFELGDYTMNNYLTWTGGANSTNWNDVNNWNPKSVPNSSSRITIPNVLNTNGYSPALPSATEIQSLSLEQGSLFTLGYDLTLNASSVFGGGALNVVGGGLTPNGKKVIFSGFGANISGNVQLYDLEITTDASLTNVEGSSVKIGGAVTKTGLWYADKYINTVEYNKAGAQTIVLTDGTAKYYNLILSGSGTKTLPSSAMSLYGNFSTAGTLSATAMGIINTAGNFEIGSGTSFTTGSFSHTVGGNFSNSGTFTSTGSTITMDGFTVQTITGSPAFDNLIISSYNKTVLAGNTTVAGNLAITSGRTFDLSTFTCNRSTTGGGTFTNAGTLKLGGIGGLGGSNFPKDYSAITLTGGTVEYYGSTQTVYTGAENNNIIISGNGALTMPSADITINNFELNNASGVTLAGNFTVNGVLNLNNGLLTLGDKNLILGASATVTGSPSGTNMVVATGTGKLMKVFTGTGSFEFPVGSFGTSLDYSPVTLNFTTGSFSSAYAGVTLTQGKQPNNSSNTSYLNRYWTISQSGITGFSCGVTLQYLAGDVVGNETDIWCGKYSEGAWTLLNQANLDANQLSGTVTSFSTFTGGEQGVLPVSLSSLSSSVIGRNIKLNWITSSENNNTGFEIERALANNEAPVYTKTGFVTGKGTTNTPTNYSFEDRNLNTGKYKYRLKQIDVNGNFEYFNLNGEVEVGVPTKYDLSQNYPNPFNPKTKINFEIPYDSKVKMIIYDVTGREIKTIVNEVRTAGYHTIVFDGSDISSGIYFYRIIANANGKDYINTKKMAIIK